MARFLAIKHGRGRLIPDYGDICAVAQFEQAASIELTSFDAVANRLVFEAFFKP